MRWLRPRLAPILSPIFAPILAAFSFLTRLPVPARGGVSDADLGRSVVWFPLVGAVLGGAAVGIERLARGHLAPGLIAVLLVAVSAVLTGGLHLDGLADTFDAWGGGRGDRARMLEIMRDSRIGAHGAVALFLVLAGKIFAMVQLQPQAPLDIFDRGMIWPLLAAPLLARWAVVPLIVLFPYARPAGLGTAFRAHARLAQLAGATVLPLALAIGASVGIGGGLGHGRLALDGGDVTSIWTAGAAALGVALALGALLTRRLGGLTGDVYGAAIELAELAVLIMASR